MSRFYTHIQSPNYGERCTNTSLDFLIMHYTACDLETALDILTDADRNHPVSAHYLIAENGDIYQLVDEEQRAWHAGESSWKGLKDINSRSIGIEIVNPGHGPNYRPFPLTQMASVSALSQEIIERHHLLPHHILGHSDIAPGRKMDPGPLFNWQWLAHRGIGIYPDTNPHIKPTFSEIDVKSLQRRFLQYGYNILVTGVLDTQTQVVIHAFQMHFWPDSVERKADFELLRRLESVLSISNRSCV